MKICVPILKRNENIGPVIFTRKLTNEFEKKGIKIVEREQKHDILLAVIRDNQISHSQKKGAKIIQRLDGIYHYLDQNYHEMNKIIRETYLKADSVIFQSAFNQKVVEKYLGTKETSLFIIPNGTNPKEFEKVNKNSRKKIFLTASKWRAFKRLESIVRGFNHAGIPNSELWILGEADKVEKDKRIKYFGEVDSSKTSVFYNKADFFMHLAYDDNCPNSVVEALVSGLPVICTSNGGTKELVRNSGEIIQEPEYDLEPYYSWEVPPVNPEKVSNAMWNVLNKRKSYEFPREDLYIENIAKRYKEAFEQVLDSKL